MPVVSGWQNLWNSSWIFFTTALIPTSVSPTHSLAAAEAGVGMEWGVLVS